MKTPETKYLKDYMAPDYSVEDLNLNIEIFDNHVIVESKMMITGNDDTILQELVLDGKALELVSVAIDDRLLSEDQYGCGDETLTLTDISGKFSLKIKTKIDPFNNKSLEGLYKSGEMLLTQCEAEGFRRITYFPDRPDVMTRYTCTIVADKVKYPVILANGDLVKKGDLDNGRHFATWEDPFQKPCYLFAMVAGELTILKDRFTTCSGRTVSLEFFVEGENKDKCAHAIESLKKSMKWDEEVYGLEYDLDTYMIVATNDFNAGAMENKGLNIFNSKYVLAKPESATDSDFQGIEGVIGHEYFHNWTGNRVTLNSWFQLSLKEGLTVFRDQEFSSDMGSRAIKRISDVRGLRASQFPEDAGPMAHPVRPESYIEMNNFYTTTVYYKGAEVIRMIHTLVGADNFRKGMDLYFKRHDGEAVTTEDFISAMETAGNKDLSQFRLWYSQAGTPVITIESAFNADAGTYSLTVDQLVPATPDKPDKKPMHIPMKMALLDRNGDEIPLTIKGETAAESGNKERVISLTKASETFIFTGIDDEPIPSLFRGFSAPVILKAGYSDRELIFLMANDRDSFNRWDAAQKLFTMAIKSLVKDVQQNKELVLDVSLIDAFRKTLTNTELDKSLIAQALSIPTETELGDTMDTIDVDAIHTARAFMIATIAEKLHQAFLDILAQNRDAGAYSIDPESIAGRKLKNLALYYISKGLEVSKAADFIYEEFCNATNMTDEIAALIIMAEMDSPLNDTSLSKFYDKWRHDTLVLDKWFAVQASTALPDTLEKVKGLLVHPDFSIENPNKVRSLIGAFCMGNPWQFNNVDGEGYIFLADMAIQLDAINPSIAARMVTGFNKWKKLDETRQNLIKTQLERISKQENLSKGVYEIVTKALS